MERGEHIKDRQVLRDSNAGAIVEGGWTRKGNDGSGAGAPDCARADEPTAKERVQVKSQNRAEVDRPTAKGRVAGIPVKGALAA